MDESAAPVKSIGELSGVEILAMAGAFALWLALVSGFIWFFWKIIRAQLRVPEEMAGIRAALERIADSLDKSR